MLTGCIGGAECAPVQRWQQQQWCPLPKFTLQIHLLPVGPCVEDKVFCISTEFSTSLPSPVLPLVRVGQKTPLAGQRPSWPQYTLTLW
jgi:hypothetical protein